MPNPPHDLVEHLTEILDAWAEIDERIGVMPDLLKPGEVQSSLAIYGDASPMVDRMRAAVARLWEKHPHNGGTNA